MERVNNNTSTQKKGKLRQIQSSNKRRWVYHCKVLRTTCKIGEGYRSLLWLRLFRKDIKKDSCMVVELILLRIRCWCRSVGRGRIRLWVWALMPPKVNCRKTVNLSNSGWKRGNWVIVAIRLRWKVASAFCRIVTCSKLLAWSLLVPIVTANKQRPYPRDNWVPSSHQIDGTMSEGRTSFFNNGMQWRITICNRLCRWSSRRIMWRRSSLSIVLVSWVIVTISRGTILSHLARIGWRFQIWRIKGHKNSWAS